MSKIWAMTLKWEGGQYWVYPINLRNHSGSKKEADWFTNIRRMLEATGKSYEFYQRPSIKSIHICSGSCSGS